MKRLFFGLWLLKIIVGLLWLIIDAIRVALFIISIPAHWDRSKKPLVDRIADLIEYKRYFLDIRPNDSGFIDNYVMYSTVMNLGYVPHYIIEKTYACRCFYYWGFSPFKTSKD